MAFQFRFDEPLNPEDSEELIAALIEEMRTKGWIVPEWIADKCREQMMELIASQFTGSLRLSLEVWKGQVADVNIIKTEDAES